MSDNINHPKHYAGKSMEVIDVIEAFDLDFELGNAVKYILRAGKKGPMTDDLEKAKWYIERVESNIEKENMRVWIDISAAINALPDEHKCETCNSWHRESMCGGLVARYGKCAKAKGMIKCASGSCDKWEASK